MWWSMVSTVLKSNIIIGKFNSRYYLAENDWSEEITKETFDFLKQKTFKTGITSLQKYNNYLENGSSYSGILDSRKLEYNQEFFGTGIIQLGEVTDNSLVTTISQRYKAIQIDNLFMGCGITFIKILIYKNFNIKEVVDITSKCALYGIPYSYILETQDNYSLLPKNTVYVESELYIYDNTELSQLSIPPSSDLTIIFYCGNGNNEFNFYKKYNTYNICYIAKQCNGIKTESLNKIKKYYNEKAKLQIIDFDNSSS